MKKILQNLLFIELETKRRKKYFADFIIKIFFIYNDN
jgi:hypothetical protein